MSSCKSFLERKEISHVTTESWGLCSKNVLLQRNPLTLCLHIRFMNLVNDIFLDLQKARKWCRHPSTLTVILHEDKLTVFKSCRGVAMSIFKTSVIFIISTFLTKLVWHFFLGSMSYLCLLNQRLTEILIYSPSINVYWIKSVCLMYSVFVNFIPVLDG